MKDMEKMKEMDEMKEMEKMKLDKKEKRSYGGLIAWIAWFCVLISLFACLFVFKNYDLVATLNSFGNKVLFLYFYFTFFPTLCFVHKLYGRIIHLIMLDIIFVMILVLGFIYIKDDATLVAFLNRLTTGFLTTKTLVSVGFKNKKQLG